MRDQAAAGERQRERATAWRPLRFAATAMVAICLGLGVALSQLTTPAASTAESAAPTDDRDEGSEASEPETSVLGAVETREELSSTPASVDHLVIVTVSVTTCGERASGTGVLIAENTILTAAHNVGDAGLVRITYGARVFTGEVAGVLADGRDLAIVHLPAPLDEPISATALLDGEAVTITGFPNGDDQRSVIGPTVAVPDLAERLWRGPLAAVDAVTSAGMSGGPAVNDAGVIVGMLVAAQPGTGTAVLATIDDIRAVLAAPLVDGRCPETA